MHPLVITVSVDCLREVEKHIENNKKIAAIKALRRGWKDAHDPDGKKGESLGLREAKDAVERIIDIRDGRAGIPNAPTIVAGPAIREIVVDFGYGPLTVDIDSMELRALRDLDSLGLEHCGRILDLCKVIKAFSEGRRIGVLD